MDNLTTGRAASKLGLPPEKGKLATTTSGLAEKIRSFLAKTVSERVAKSAELVYQLLKACITGKEPEHCVFTTSDGNPVTDFRISWKRACAEAGVPGLLFHDLRRTAVRGLVRSGISEHVAMKISGHKTRSTFDRYDIVSDADLRDAARKLELARQAQTIAQVQQTKEQPIGTQLSTQSAMLETTGKSN